MDTSTMDKKNLPRNSLPSSKNGQEIPSKDNAVRRNGQGSNGRRRDYDKTDYYAKKNSLPKGGKGGIGGGGMAQRFNRPREKTNSQVKVEEGSLFHGRKKQNITHLMDWWGPTHTEKNAAQSKNWTSKNRGGARPKWNSSGCHKYNKEHYLQANCQFIVMEGNDYATYEYEPDSLVQWDLVEEVRLHISEATNCPICLHPPTAAQITRCGHIYCYSCILHYLALTDDTWRKCPICDEEVTKDHLKSVVCEIYQDFQIGDEVELQLMKRNKDSLIAVPVLEATDDYDKKWVSKLLNYNSLSRYTKLFIATNTEVCENIIAREEKELLHQLATEGDIPESIFAEDALKLLEQRRNNLLSLSASLAKLSLLNEHLDCASSIQSDSNANKPPTLSMSPTSPTYDLNTSRTVEHFDISQLQPQNSQSTTKNQPKGCFFFYQLKNGSHMYLHALNVHMLVHEYGSLDKCPPVIKGNILEKESASMTEDLRNRLRYLRHLPITCPFEVVEINLGPIVSPETVAEYQTQIDARQRKRNKKVKEEKKIERRVKAEEDRFWGRTRGREISFQSSHFPSFATEDAPSSSVEIPIEQDDNLNGTSPVASPESDSSVPSFAQMIRETPKKNDWPSVGNGNTNTTQPTGWVVLGSNSNTAPRTRTTTECSEDSVENMAAAPQFKDTFSDAFSKALDAAAAKKAQDDQNKTPDSGSGKGRKKKRQKGVVLLSSGGF